MEIRPIQKSEYLEASKLLSQAFQKTPLINAAIYDNNSKILQLAFKFMISKKNAKVIVAKEDKIVGVMTMVQCPEKKYSLIFKIKKLLTRIFGNKTAKNLLRIEKIWKKYDPKKPHWHLGPIAVLPEKQNNGIGKKLIAYCIENIDGPAYLEVDQIKNVKLYEKFDFKVIGTTEILSIKNWFMWRD